MTRQMFHCIKTQIYKANLTYPTQCIPIYPTQRREGQNRLGLFCSRSTGSYDLTYPKLTLTLGNITQQMEIFELSFWHHQAGFNSHKLDDW